MSLSETARRAVLGEPIDPPTSLPAGALPDGVQLRAGRFIPRIGGLLGRMRGPAHAVTLGRTIIVHPEVRLDRRLLDHELVHVRQWRQDALFPLRYTLATLRHGYWNNPYEVEAREASAAPPPSPTAEHAS